MRHHTQQHNNNNKKEPDKHVTHTARTYIICGVLWGVFGVVDGDGGRGCVVRVSVLARTRERNA